ncbi:reverse transcriptase domain-containing protein [Ensifer sp. LCM 4579]|uniref:reverse transcriptase domain-containing protein n=1 Tax=Ensifer sp. LCM 4579 TaxID=1848292 RepID=UPI00387E9846
MRRRKWVLDADIKGAFDSIDHQFLLDAIGGFPARELIRQWLKAGYMERGVFHDTDSGTPQGGIITPERKR